MVPKHWKVRMGMLCPQARTSSRGEGSPTSTRGGGGRRSQELLETAYKHLKKLEEAGYVEKEGSMRRARDVRLTEKGWEAAGEVPLLGRLAVGGGLELSRLETMRILWRLSYLARALGRTVTYYGWWGSP